MILYAGNISNLTDARFFSSWNIQGLGFRMSDIPSLAQLKAICEWVEGPEFFLELDISSLHVLEKDITSLGVNKLIIPDQMDPASIQAYDTMPMIVSVCYSADRNWAEVHRRLELWQAYTDTIILDFFTNRVPIPGTEHEAEIRKLSTHFKLLLGMYPPTHVSSATLESMGVEGLYLSGGKEEKTGLKSYDEWEEILEVFGDWE